MRNGTGVQTAEAARGRAFAKYAWAVLAYNLGVIVWGAYVRASGSGDGCGNHWPLCQGAVAPHSPTLKTIIEFTHRATSGIDTFLVALLVWWAFRTFPRRHPARLGAVLSAVFLVSEALIGAGLVLFNQVAQNESISRAWWLSGHLINTLTLVACLALTAWWGMGRPAARPRGGSAWWAGSSLGLLMLLGISGAIAALGDTLFPARSLAAGFAQDFSSAANIFVRLRAVHPFLAVLVAAWLAAFGVASWRRGASRRLAAAMLGLVIAQVTAGITNLLLLAPVGMQLAHLLIADLLWISLVLLAASLPPMRTPPAPTGPSGDDLAHRAARFEPARSAFH
ncbi:MAG TPA: COX15/CtaA family protein [Bryobacteraceae bacterium]|nr:COX15/CtaA family protein [Bryobacteraceae bacterium]